MKSAKINFRNKILLLLFLGDVMCAMLGISLGYFLRFHTPLKTIGVEAAELKYIDYLPLILVGALFLVFSYAKQGIYSWKLLLRPKKLRFGLVKASSYWLLIYLFLSLALKFEPSISRMFVIYSWLSVNIITMIWHTSLLKLLTLSSLSENLVQKVAILGWNDDARALAHAMYSDSHHPYYVEGIILTNGDIGLHKDRLDNIYSKLGTVNEIEAILKASQIDIVVIADLDLNKDLISKVARTCEVNYTDLKMTPSMFQIFVSGLHLETISGLPILGVEELRINKISSQMLKRTIDIVGSIVGLILSAPIVLFLSFVIKREDPGPIIYRQIRTGKNGKPFTIYKLRSMKLDAEKHGGAQWAKQNDPRRLRVGAFMRENNLDELPQFWNVLRGDMSLVGPRPERPELIAKFEQEIDHYNPRHVVKPGITGWAQVNGLRGDTSLVDRIRYDIYYIENWNWFFDWQIMMMTFLKRDNAY